MKITHHDFLFWTEWTMNSSWRFLSWATHIEKATGPPWEGFWASENSETQLFRAALSTVTCGHMWPRTLKLNKTETSAPQSRWPHSKWSGHTWLVAPMLHIQQRTEHFSLQKGLLASHRKELDNAGVESAFMFFLLTFSVFSISVYFFNQSFFQPIILPPSVPIS